MEAQIFENFRRVELLGVCLELRAGECFDFLPSCLNVKDTQVANLPW